MGILIAVIAICAIAISTIVESNDYPIENREVLSATVSPFPILSPTPTATTLSVTQTTVQPKHTPLPTESSMSSGRGFLYPNAQVTENTGSRLKLTTTDSTEKVTEWYQGQINAEGMKTTSFVKTKTNGIVVNKLAGASSQSKVAVEITKSPNSILVNILVTY